MMATISLTAPSAIIQEVVSVTISTKWHSNVIILYNITIQWLNNYIHYYLLTHFITMLMKQALPPFQLPCSEYTNAHAQLNSM